MSEKQDKCLVIADFVPLPDSSEIPLVKGEVVTVTRRNEVGHGWWEGVNSSGQVGLMPSTYLEELSHPDKLSGAGDALNSPFRTDSSWDDKEVNKGATVGQKVASANETQGIQFKAPITPQQATEEPDWPDEDWDDEEDSDDNPTDYATEPGLRGYSNRASYYGASINALNTGGNLVGPSQGGSDLCQATTNLSMADDKNQQLSTIRSKKNFTRFPNLGKPVLQSYILENTNIAVPHENIVYIQSDPELGIIWKPNLAHYICNVKTHGKETKMKGLKTYISYEITPSTNNVVVRRRYKHFDWLMQRLYQKFIATPLPHLPEKQIAGRFQEDFVEHRRNLLQLWVNYITRHPILSRCDVWWHFITCRTDDMKGWKLGKRKAEKDSLVGDNFFFSVGIDPSTPPLDQVKTSKQIENFQRFVSKFDEAVKHMFMTAIDQSKKLSTVYSRDYKRLSDSIRGLSSAFQSGTAWRNSLGLNEAIRQTGAAYEDISRLHENEPKHDFEPMADMLHQYRGLLSSWPEILQIQKSAIGFRNDLEDKISETDISRINLRVDTVTYTTLAEINHFHNERLVDFKQMMKSFLTAQINFHSEILAKLQSSLNKINDA